MFLWLCKIAGLKNEHESGTDRQLERIASALESLNCNQAILHRLAEMESRIMSKISDFATAQNAFNDRIDTAITGLTGDVAELNAEIKKLQDSAGTVTPEDQALLDGIQARSDGIATKLEALDALTPPVPPTTPVV